MSTAHLPQAELHTGAPPPSHWVRKIWNILHGYRRGLFVLLLPVGVLLTEWAARFPRAVEQLYSKGVYRSLASLLGRIFGLVPFSVAELLLYSLIIIVLLWLTVHIARMIRRKDFKTRLPGMLATLACGAGIGYFLFTLLCGLNYHRITFAEQSGLTVRPSSVSELAALYEELIDTANQARQQVTTNEHGVMILSQESYYATGARASDTMNQLAQSYPVLTGFTPRAKPVLFSRGMSSLNITGIYVPFTFEGSINVDIPHYEIPFTMIHELSHFKGFMREDEANFIAYLGCRESADADFLYSGAVLALLHSGNALYRADSDLYFSLSENLTDGVLRDLADGSLYWQQFQGPIAEVASKVNDSYLKANRQAEGVQSYGRMVDLLLADYRDRHNLI